MAYLFLFLWHACVLYLLLLHVVDIKHKTRLYLYLCLLYSNIKYGTNVHTNKSKIINILQMAFHDKKDEKPAKKLKSTSSGESTKGLNQDQVVEINHKVDSKIQRVEENIFQWIDEEARSIKDHLEKDINSIRFEVDNKSVDLNSKIQSSIHDFKDEVNLKVAVIDSKINEAIFNEYKFPIDNTIEDSTGAARAILDLKNKLHKNCNTLRFLCSEPLSVQFSIWNKGELKVPQEENEKLLTFNWINCNVGGAVVDGEVSA